MSWLGDHWTRAIDPLNLSGLDETAQKKANETAEALKAGAPMPGEIQWNNTYDPKTMAMTPDVQAHLAGINMDKTALNKFQSEAMRTGPSAFAKLAGSQQDLLAKNAKDAGARTVAGQGAGARASLAMRGGLSGGAAERLATEGQNNYLDMTQGVNNSLAQNKMQIGMNDEQNRVTQLGMVPGMQAQATGIDLQKESLWDKARENDVNNQVQNNASKNTFDMNMYNQKMAAWAAGQTAGATASAGKHKK